MSKFKVLILLFVACTIGFMACQEAGGGLVATNDTLNSIPADVSSVTKINVQSLMDKMDFKAVQKMEFFQDALQEARKESEIGAKIMENPEMSGIDLSKNIYMAYDVDPKVIGNIFTYATASIKDQTAFEAMLKEGGAGDFETKEGFKMVKPGRKQVVAWNDEMAVIGNSMTYMDLEKSVAKVFTTDKENSIAKNANFKKSFTGKHDIETWAGTHTISQNSDAKMMVGFMNIKPEALEGNFTSGFMDFLDGEIAGKSDYKINKELSKDLDLFFKDNPKTDFGKYIPGDNLGFGMTAALDLKGINQVLSERPQAKSMMNFGLREYGLEFDQIVAALGGDIIVTGYSNKDNPNKGSGLFATNIGDRGEFDKILKVAVDAGLLTKESDDKYATKIPSAGFSGGAKLMIHKGLLFVSEDGSLLEKVENGDFSSSDLSKKVKRLSSDNIFSLAADFSIFKEGMDELQKFGGRFFEITTNRTNADMKMEFDDKKTNSLKQIMELINEAYLQSQKEEGKSI